MIKTITIQKTVKSPGVTPKAGTSPLMILILFIYKNCIYSREPSVCFVWKLYLIFSISSEHQTLLFRIKTPKSYFWPVPVSFCQATQVSEYTWKGSAAIHQDNDDETQVDHPTGQWSRTYCKGDSQLVPEIENNGPVAQLELNRPFVESADDKDSLAGPPGLLNIWRLSA